ncbi:MAG: hypothetical protein WCF30_05895 [Terracidiphilus sp.]
MRPLSVFLRKTCVLPEPLDPWTEPVGEHWTHVEEITVPVFETMIRQKGWHFMPVDNLCTRKGFGLTEDAAVQRALLRTLNRVAERFNSAELIAVHAAKYPGFYVASVTLQPRQLQHHTWLEIAGDWQPLPVPVG